MIYQDLMRKRKAQDHIASITIARTTLAEADEVNELVESIKRDAGLPLATYLEAEMDKEGLAALAQQLNRGSDKNI